MRELEKKLRSQIAEKMECLDDWSIRAVTTETELASLRLQYISDFVQMQDKTVAPTPTSADHIPDVTKMVVPEHCLKALDSAMCNNEICPRAGHVDSCCAPGLRELYQLLITAPEPPSEQPDSAAPEPVAYLDLAKVATGMAYATNFRTTDKQTPLYLRPPTNPRRITEQDAIAMLDEYFAFGGSDYKKWLQTNHAKILLNFLNENREPDYKAQLNELITILKDTHEFLEGEGYYPLLEIKAAIAKAEGLK